MQFTEEILKVKRQKALVYATLPASSDEVVKLRLPHLSNVKSRLRKQ
jgi:hypothetical protein